MTVHANTSCTYRCSKSKQNIGRPCVHAVEREKKIEQNFSSFLFCFVTACLIYCPFAPPFLLFTVVMSIGDMFFFCLDSACFFLPHSYKVVLGMYIEILQDRITTGRRTFLYRLLIFFCICFPYFSLFLSLLMQTMFSLQTLFVSFSLVGPFIYASLNTKDVCD